MSSSQFSGLSFVTLGSFHRVDSFMFISVYFVYFVNCVCVILLWAWWGGPDGIEV